MSRSEISESISQQIDIQVRDMVKRCYEETVEIVSSNREVIDRLVELLIEKETMNGDEFKSIVSEFTAVPEKDRTVVTLD
jgi:cell division protease FtsH